MGAECPYNSCNKRKRGKQIVLSCQLHIAKINNATIMAFAAQCLWLLCMKMVMSM